MAADNAHDATNIPPTRATRHGCEDLDQAGAGKIDNSAQSQDATLAPGNTLSEIAKVVAGNMHAPATGTGIDDTFLPTTSSAAMNAKKPGAVAVGVPDETAMVKGDESQSKKDHVVAVGIGTGIPPSSCGEPPKAPGAPSRARKSPGETRETAANRKLGALDAEDTKTGDRVATSEDVASMKQATQEFNRRGVGGLFASARNSDSTPPPTNALLQFTSSLGVQSLPSEAPPPEPTLPGAYAQMGVAWRNPRPGHFGNDRSSSRFTAHNTSEALRASIPAVPRESVSGLVQASMVAPSEDFSRRDLQVAEPLEDSSREHQGLVPLEERKNSVLSKQFYLLVGGCVFLAAAVVLLVVIVTQSSAVQQADSNSINAAPSAAPTQEPLLSLLPHSTQAIIDKDSNVTTPQSLAYQWMLEDPNLHSYSNGRLLQRFAMATLYYSTEGPNWKQQGGGTVSVEVPELPGGPPPESGGSGNGPPPGPMGPPPPQGGPGGGNVLVNITSETWLGYDDHECQWFTYAMDTMCPKDNQTMDVFKMIKNNLTGSLPNELGLLSKLVELEIFQDHLGGRLPSQIGLLTNLKTLRLNSNQLSGAIPPEIGLLSNSLSSFSVLDNQMIGSIPTQFWQLSHLHEIKTHRNHLTGSLPTNFGNLLPNLQFMVIGNNFHTGSFPSSIGQHTGLVRFTAGENLFTGTLPTELGLVRSLFELKLDKNLLTGMLPSEMGMLPAIARINLEENTGLSGTIPNEWNNLNGTLRGLILSGTNVTGTIPSSLCFVRGLSFDCSKTLCGCSACPCSSFNISI